MHRKAPRLRYGHGNLRIRKGGGGEGGGEEEKEEKEVDVR